MPRRGGRPAVALILLGLLAGCAGSATTASGASSSFPPPSARSSTPADDSTPLARVRAAIDRFNATAGKQVAAQQQVLEALVSSGQTAQQRACPVATTTIELEPVYARLTAAPQWHPSSGTMAGTAYALPTLIRIYTGDRITGTDLTDLHLTIDAGQVRFPAICLR